jgi:hypothetical protein
MAHVITTPSFDDVTVDLRVDVKIEEIEVANMEE